MIQELVNSSYEHCFRNEMESLLGDDDFLDPNSCGTENVTRVRLINSSFTSLLQRAITKLQDATLRLKKPAKSRPTRKYAERGRDRRAVKLRKARKSATPPT